MLWDIPTGLPLGPAFVVPGGITSLAFLPDGKRLFSGGRNGLLLSWDTDPDSWIKKACAIANRDLTEPEWSDNFEDEPYRPTCPDAPVPHSSK